MLHVQSIDHVASAWSDHTAAVDRFEAAGVSTRFGGEHADGTTQMSIVPFADGSYLELIAPTPETAPGETVRWPDHVSGDAGPCAWCVDVDDVVGAAKSAIDAGEPVVGPQQGGRSRPDGVEIEWDELFVGPTADRHALPFYVRDRTPRSYRVPPAWQHSGPIRGIDEVVIAVDDLHSWLDRFTRLFRLPSPIRTTDDRLDAQIAVVPGYPLSIATPRSTASPLAERLDRYPPGPAACLFGVESIDAAVRAYDLAAPTTFGDRRVAWFAGELGDRFGVVETGE
ncbi:MAG: VOC family protein [Halobacteriota archaeon]